MWIFVQEPKPTGSKLDSEHLVQQAPNKWGLLPGQSYTVGRLTGDITHPSDTTVSKEHAKITVIQTEGQQRPEIVLEDVGSRFGTFLNEEILAESQRLAASSGGTSKALRKPRVLQENDRIRFGVAYCIFRLKWLELTVISSMLNSKADKTNLSLWIQTVDKTAIVHQSMSEKTSHLVMTNISLSIKVVNCLAQGIPIVTPQFFRDVDQCLKTKQKLPLEEDYLPSVSTKESESQLKDPTISFGVNFARSRLFHDKLFVFVDKKQFDVNSPPCRLAGGKTFLLETDDKVNAIKPHHVVILPPNNKTLLADSEGLWSQVMSRLSSLEMTACSQTEIYLAIVHCSVENFCNPQRNKKNVINVANSSTTDSVVKKTSPLFVPDTCSVSGSPLHGIRPASNSRLVVSETLSNPASSLNDQTQRLEPLPMFGDTQIMDGDGDKSLKRPRVSDTEDDEVPLAKHQHVDNSKIDGPAASKVVNMQVQDSVLTVGEEKENVNTNSSSFKKPASVNTVSESEDEEDMFGFGSLNTKKRKPVSPVKSQNQAASKRVRHNDDDDMDDIFGFDNDKDKVENRSKTSPTKIVESSSIQIASSISNDESFDKKEKNVVSKPMKTPIRHIKVVSTGFIGKEDIKRENKEETKGGVDDDELSTLSVSVAKINVSLNLLRPASSKPKPRFVPNDAGKSIPNFKKFKRKEENVRSRRLISLVTFDPIREKMNQTRVDEWIQENQNETSSRQDGYHNDSTSDQEENDEFWNFDVGKSSRKRSSRR